MARPAGEKTRCSGQWTESKFNTFVRNQLRRASYKWAPLQEVKKAANVRRGFYLCAGCKQEVTASIKDGKKRVNNVYVDHIEPIVNPKVGFEGFDVFIDRLFCEADNLQVLCKDCHDKKTNEERAQAVERRKNEL